MDRILKIVREEFSWVSMKPITIKATQETYTQAEVDAAIKFYKTPEGAAYLAKTPQLMQKMQLHTQEKMISLLRRSATTTLRYVDCPTRQSPHTASHRSRHRWAEETLQTIRLLEKSLRHPSAVAYLQPP
jgi:hypothetical protein